MGYPSFTTGEVLTAADMNAVGLWRVTTCTVTSAGGTAATASNGVITVGTGNTSVTVNSAFSADYDNYYLTFTGGVLSAGSIINLQLGASTTGYYNILVYGGSYATPTPTGISRNNGANFSWVGYGDTNYAIAECDLHQPYLAKYTGIRNAYMGQSNAGHSAGTHQVSTSYTGFTLLPNDVGVTMTGGQIRVYGYRN